MQTQCHEALTCRALSVRCSLASPARAAAFISPLTATRVCMRAPATAPRDLRLDARPDAGHHAVSHPQKYGMHLIPDTKCDKILCLKMDSAQGTGILHLPAAVK